MRRLVSTFCLVGLLGGVLAVVPEVIVGGGRALAAGSEYRDVVVGDGPVHYWRLNDSGTVAADEMGALPGTITGNVTTGVVPGAVADSGNSALKLNGGTGHVDLGNQTQTSLKPSGDLTVEAWFRTSSVATQTIGRYRTFGWHLNLTGSTGQVNGQLFDLGGTNHTVSSGPGFNDGEWHHAALVRNGNLVMLYVDGELQDSDSMTGPNRYEPSGNAGGASIGRDGNVNLSFFVGDIDEFALYHAGLSAGQVLEHFETGCPSCRLLEDSEFFGPNDSMPGECPCNASRGKPVNTRTGNEHFVLPGLYVPGRGPGLAVQVAYNSLDSSSYGPVGFGWRHSYDMSMSLEADGSRLVVQETGATVRFYPDGSGGWRAPGRMNAVLTENSVAGTFTMERNFFEFFTFDTATGRLVSVGDRNGYETTLAWQSATVLHVTDEAGRTLVITHDATSGRVTSVADPREVADGGSRSLSFSYDGNGNLTSYTDIGGGVWTLGYDGSHRLTSIRTPRHVGDPSKQWILHYDTQGRVDWQEDELDRRTLFIYEDSGHPDAVTGGTRVVDPEGDSTVHFHDALGRRTAVTSGYGTADATTTEFFYDPVTYMMVRMLDGEDKEWNYEYDRFYVSKVTDPLGREMTATYNDFGQPLTITNDEGEVTKYTYDVDGNVLTSTAAFGSADAATTTFVYDSVAPVFPGDVTTMTDARNNDWLYEYDETTGYLESATDPEGNETTTAYNSIGWVEHVTAPLGNVVGATAEDFRTHFEYNDYGDPTLTTNAEDEEVERQYNANRQLTSVINDQGEETRYVYTDTGQVGAVITGYGTADASTIAYEYYDDSQRELWRDGNGDEWGYDYDAVGRLVTETDPNLNSTAYTYDGRGLLETITQPGGDCATPVGCITYEYDNAGQLTGIDYSEDAPSDVTAVTYDNVGRRTSVTQANGDDWAWTYTDRGQVKSYTNEVDDITSYTWDPNGNLDTITYPGSTGGTVDYDYDDASRMIEVTDWLSNETTFDWDENSRLDATIFPTASGFVDDYGYDNANRIDTIDYIQSSTTVASIDYARTDGDGLITDAVTTGLPTGPDEFGYDARDQLTTLDTVTSFDYDPAGNLTTLPDGRLQVFDPAQQLCWSSPTATSGSCATPPGDATSYDYDDRGNRTDRWEPDGTHSQYSFDQANRLTSAAVADETGSQYHIVTAATVLETTSGSQVGECPTSSAQCTTFNTANGRLRTVQIAGQAGLPAAGEIEAVMINVTAKNTVVSGSGTAFLSVYPADISWPWGYTLAFQNSEYISNSIITRVDGNGQINVLVSGGDSDVNIVVEGYFAKPDPDAGIQFVATNPGALLHYANSSIGDCSPATCGPLTAATPSLNVKVLGHGGVPNDPEITAVALSVTVTNPTSGGALLIGPNGGAPSVNFIYTAGDSTANSAIVPIGTDGRITVGKLFSTGDANVVLTVQGYFTGDPDANEGGLHLFEVPAVALNTAPNPPTGTCPSPSTSCDTLSANQILDVQLGGVAGVPAANVDAVVVNMTVTNPTANGWITVWPYNTGYPFVASMFYEAGTLTGTSAIVPIDPATGRVLIHTTAGLDLRIDIQGYIASGDTITFDYDADGLRTSKTSTHTGTTDYVWDQSGGLPLLLTETNGDNTTHIIYGPGGRPLTEIRNDGTTNTVNWYHADHLGSTRLTTNNAGTVTGTYTYDSYGALADATGPNTPTLGYAGQYADAETGLIYLRARYYEPDTGQFLARDPLVSVTHDPYSYASNNPANLVDPLGLFGIPSWVPIVGGMCVDVGDPDCESHAERNPGVTGAVVDFAGGVLDVNPVTSFLPLDLEGNGVNTSSAFFTLGKGAMVATETVLGGLWSGANVFNGGASAIYAMSVCGGVRHASCSGAIFGAVVGGLSGLGARVGEPAVTHSLSALGNFIAAFGSDPTHKVSSPLCFDK